MTFDTATTEQLKTFVSYLRSANEKGFIPIRAALIGGSHFARCALGCALPRDPGDCRKILDTYNGYYNGLRVILGFSLEDPHLHLWEDFYTEVARLFDSPYSNNGNLTYYTFDTFADLVEREINNRELAVDA